MEELKQPMEHMEENSSVSEPTEGITEADNIIEKKRKKVAKPRSKAQVESFKKAQLALINKRKLAKNAKLLNNKPVIITDLGSIKEEKEIAVPVKEVKKDKKLKNNRKVIYLPPENDSSSSEEETIYIKPPRKHKKKKKKKVTKVIYLSGSESESDPDSDIDIQCAGSVDIKHNNKYRYY